MGMLDCKLIDPDVADRAFANFRNYPAFQARALLFAYSPNPHRLTIAELTGALLHIDLVRRIENDPKKWDDVKSSTLRWQAGREHEIEGLNSSVLAILPQIARERLLEEINKRI